MAEQKLYIEAERRIKEFQDALKYLQFNKKVYQIIFRGKSFDFDSYRNYEPDDDASLIDWKASLKANRFLVRRYIEEKDKRVVFVLDVGSSMVFGSGEKLKCEYAAEVALALAHLIVSLGDKIAFVLVSDHVVSYSMPRGGLKQFYFFAQEISNPKIYSGASKISAALKFVADSYEKITAVVLLSDFLSLEKNFLDSLHYLSAKFETIALMIKDIRDIELSGVSGEFLIEDPLSGEQLLVNPKIAKSAYEKYAQRQENLVKEIFRKSNVDYLKLITSEPFAYKLAYFLKERVRGV